MVGQYQIFKVAFPRPPLQPTFSLTHRHIRTYTHILSLSLALSIIAHDARNINESSTVNKQGENKTLCGALLTVVEVEVEVEVGEEEEVEEE